MEFKIDTKINFTIITPVAETVNANLSEKLVAQVEELTNSGSKNFVIDLSPCSTVNEEAIDLLLSLHEYCYTHEHSLVFLQAPESLLSSLKQNDMQDMLNLAPTIAEATDIINMEILERDLFGEE